MGCKPAARRTLRWTTAISPRQAIDFTVPGRRTAAGQIAAPSTSGWRELRITIGMLCRTAGFTVGGYAVHVGPDLDFVGRNAGGHERRRQIAAAAAERGCARITAALSWLACPTRSRPNSV